MIQDYWWAIFIGLALLALIVVLLVVGRRRGVGGEAAASLRDLDGTQSARPTFARPDPMSTAPPVATGGSIAEAEPVPTERVDDGAIQSAMDDAGLPGPSAAAEAAAMDDAAPTVSQPTGDDLTRMKGVGPKLRDQLATLGVTRFDQIAGWDEAEIDRIDSQLGRFTGRIRRDDWIEQARFLAADDRAGYEARFGALR